VSARARVEVSPAVLRWARESSAVPIHDAAARVAQPFEVVAGWESGTERPTLGALETLATLYGRPLAVFLLDQPPAEPPAPVDFRSSSGEGAQDLTRQTHAAIRQARRLQRLVADLVGSDWALAPFDHETVLDAAARERSAIGMDVDAPVSWASVGMALREWRAAVERQGVLVLQADIPLGDVRALSLPGTPPVVVLNEHDLQVARIFSLFHEYAHLRLGTGGVCNPMTRLTDRSPTVEALCNTFAGAFLVPGEALNEAVASIPGGKDLSDRVLKSLASRFHVSRQVIWYRLRDLRLISVDTFHGRWAEWAHERRPAPRNSAPHIARWQKAAWRFSPALIDRLLRAEERNELTMSEVLTYLDVPLEALTRLGPRTGRRA
jgi:Zn-dependent peptidase ImmA (M78 family)/transcriptional regulator with XRE-family HTH domain